MSTPVQMMPSQPSKKPAPKVQKEDAMLLQRK
jgi:hypothetical protein